MKESLDLLTQSIFNKTSILERYRNNKNSLKNMKLPEPEELRPYLKTLLEAWLQGGDLKPMPTLTGAGVCILASVGKKQNRRMHLAVKDFLTALNAKWQAQQANLHWIRCYLDENHPNTNLPNWKFFHCSHICISAGQSETKICISSNHCHWEPDNVNFSRAAVGTDGKNICRRKSLFNEEHVCKRELLHIPSCI
jgi:hypothetical protein